MNRLLPILLVLLAVPASAGWYSGTTGSGAKVPISIIAGPSGDATNGTSSNSTCLLTTTGPARLILMVGFGATSGSNITVTSITGAGLDGSWTQVSTGSSGTTYAAEIWTVIAPSALSSQTFVMNNTGAANTGLKCLAVPVSTSIGTVIPKTTLTVVPVTWSFTGLKSGSLLLGAAWTNPFNNLGVAGANTTLIDHQNHAVAFVRSTTNTTTSSLDLSLSGDTWNDGQFTGVEIKE